MTALRFLAIEGLAERHNLYTVDVWEKDGSGSVAEHVGSLTKLDAARATFQMACERRPSHEVTLRHGIRVVEKREQT